MRKDGHNNPRIRGLCYIRRYIFRRLRGDALGGPDGRGEMTQRQPARVHLMQRNANAARAVSSLLTLQFFAQDNRIFETEETISRESAIFIKRILPFIVINSDDY